MSGISVIICCYNSELRIEETLNFIFLQKTPPSLLWEVIVVNNASTDNTEGVVSKFNHVDSQKRLRLVNEPAPGLAKARQKGIQTSIYDFLLFCDDDNHLESDYIRRAFELMSDNREIGVAGGWIKPKLPFYPGKWIEANYPALAIGQPSSKPGYVDWVFGAGMVLRKQIFNTLKEKGISLMLSGRLGAKQTSGDDAEMCQLARFVGYKVLYSPDLVLYHKISAHRLTRWSFVKANFMNVYHVIYFYLLENLIKQANISTRKIYFRFINTRFHSLFYFFPRIFFGRNNFFSFMMFFQNFQLLFWVFLKRKHFSETHKSIKANLYDGSAKQ
jgi:glycosyltransferase involved in cell wall biosynthesis